MKTTRWSLASLGVMVAVAAFFVTDVVQAAEPSGKKVDVMKLEAIPAGNYLVELQIEGETRLANFKVDGDRLECVESKFPSAVGMRGGCFPVGNGVFMVQVRNSKHASTMFWAFRPDGSASIKEVPDRGEKHAAVPVEGATLERP